MRRDDRVRSNQELNPCSTEG